MQKRISTNRKHKLSIILLLVCFISATGQNLIKNNGFEDGFEGWKRSKGVSVDTTEKRSGAYSLKVTGAKGDAAANIKEVILNQKEPQTVEVSYWGMRTSLDPKVLSAIQVDVCFNDGTRINWYPQFFIDSTQAGEWVFRRSVFYPRSPIKKLRINVRRSGVGRMWIDDLYAGLPRKDVSAKELAERKRSLPIVVIPKSRTYENSLARFKLLSILPTANVINYIGPDKMPLSVKISYEVTKPAPISLNSRSGSQVWTAFNLNTKRLIAFHLGEKIDLANKGIQTCEGDFINNMGLARYYNPLQKGSYILLTGNGIAKTFNIVSEEKVIGQCKIKDMGLHYNPVDKRPVFLTANLKKYKLKFTGLGSNWKKGGKIWTKIILIDADKDEFTLYRAKVKAKIKNIDINLRQEFDSTGMPTGMFVGKIPGSVSLSDKIAFNAAITVNSANSVIAEKITAVLNKGEGESALKENPVNTIFTGLRSGDYINHYVYNPDPVKGPKNLRHFIRKMAEAGMNMTTIHANSRGKACYKSKILPLQYPDWDPLKVAIDAAHKNKIKIAACVCLFLRYRNHKPEWVAVNKAGKKVDGWYEFSNPEVRKYCIEIIKEILENYDIDILYLDYIRPGYGGYSESSRKEYKKKFGRDPLNLNSYDPELVQWRTGIINEFLKEIKSVAKKIKPDVKLMTYVWAMYNPVNSRAQQDIPGWFKEGSFDMLMMGNYTRNLYRYRAVCNVLKYIQLQNPSQNASQKKTQIWPLMGVAYTIANSVSFKEEENLVSQQILITKQEGFDNIGFFTCHTIAPYMEDMGRKYFKKRDNRKSK